MHGDSTAELIGWLSSKANSTFEAAFESMMEISLLLDEIVSVIPWKNGNMFSPLFGQIDPPEFARKVAPALKEACSHLAQKTDAGFGYSIELKNTFTYEKTISGVRRTEDFNGMFLTLVSPDSKDVGALEIGISLPFRITMIQGINNGEPQKFAKASNGQTFDIVLLNRTIDCIGATVYFEPSDPLSKRPKAELCLDPFMPLKPHEKMLNRLSRYIPADKVNGFLFSETLRYHAPLRQGLFSDARSRTMRQKRTHAIIK